MNRLVRAVEAIDLTIFFAVLLAPLVFFLVKTAPWTPGALAVLGERGSWTAIGNSLILMTLTAILSTGLGFLFLWTLWRYRWERGTARTLTVLLKLPYLIPPFFLAMGWISLAAPEAGYANLIMRVLRLPELPSIYGLGGSIFVLVLWSTSLAMIQLQSFFEHFSGELEDAAIMCGASPRRALIEITLPLAKPHLLSCGLLTAVSALSAFGVPGLLALPARQFVLTTRIYTSIKGAFDFGQTAVLSFLLLVITGILLVIRRSFFRGTEVPVATGKVTRSSGLRPGLGGQSLLAFATVFGGLSFILPAIAIMLRALLRDPSDFTTATLERITYVFTKVPEVGMALSNSLIIATITTMVVTALSVVIVYGARRLRYKISRFLAEGWDVGYALPSTIIALSLLIFFSGTLTDTLWILAVAYIVKFSAFPLGTIGPAMAAVSRDCEEATWLAGASRFQGFYRIIVPWLRPAIAAGFLLSLIPMVSELTMSVLLIGPGTETLGTLIYRLQEYADPGAAAVLALTISIATLVLNAITRRLSRGKLGI